MSTLTSPKTKPRYSSAVPHGARTFAAVLGLLLAAATGAAAGEPSDAQPGGAFTCDFELYPIPLLPPNEIAPSIERDRMYMAARPGLLHKHIPISLPTPRAMYFPEDGICSIPPRTPASIGIGSSTATCSTVCCSSSGPTFSAPTAMPGP